MENSNTSNHTTILRLYNKVINMENCQPQYKETANDNKTKENLLITTTTLPLMDNKNQIHANP